MLDDLKKAIKSIEAQISSSSSTQILIKTKTPDGVQVAIGTVKKFHVSQKRDLKNELVRNEKDGTYTTELIPGPVETLLYLERTVFDKLSLPEALGRGLKNIQAQTQPFDIVVEDHAIPGEMAITTYNNCWFKELHTPIDVDDYIIIQTATLYCENMSTPLKVIKPNEAP